MATELPVEVVMISQESTTKDVKLVGSFTILAVLGQSMERVCGGRSVLLRLGNTAPFKERRSGGEPLATLCSI